MEIEQRGQSRVRVYCAHGHACWTVGLVLAVAAAIATRIRDVPTPGVRTTLGVIVCVLVTVVALLVIAELKTSIRVGARGLTIRHWPDFDHFVPWNEVVGMRWEHGWWGALARQLRLRCQPGAHGFVELEIADPEGRVHSNTIVNYVCLGRPPVSVLGMIEDIAAKAGLAPDDQRPEPWYPHFDQMVWHKAASRSCGKSA